MPKKHWIEFEVYQAVQTGMGTKKEIEEGYSYASVVMWNALAVYEEYTIRKQQPDA